MKIRATFNEEVTIDPIDIIQELIDEVQHGWRSWIFEENGKYYRGWERSAGSHSFDEQEEISKEDYEYYQALKLIKPLDGLIVSLKEITDEFEE